MGSRVKGQADRILEAFGSRVLKLSRINLGRSFQATRPNGKKYRKRIDASGTLKRSLDYDVKLRGEDGRFTQGTIVFKMADYGRYVDAGQKGAKSTYRASRKSPYKRKKQPPVNVLTKWADKKLKRIQDLEKGGFKKKTDAAVKSLAYLIGRKIKNHGIEATHFFSEPLEQETAKLADALASALGDDYSNGFGQDIGE